VARDLDLNINGDARRARAALNDVATGSARAARIADQLSRSFDHLESEANDAQRALDRVNREIADNGPTAELNAELAQLQHRLSEISDERRVTEGLRAEFRRATASAATLDHELAAVRRELDRLNDEYSRGGDPAVLRRIQEQQRELQRLNGIRRRIADEDENNQARLARLAEEARRAQLRREEEDRRRRDDEDNRSFLRRLRRRASNLGDGSGTRLPGVGAPPQVLAAGGALGAAAAGPILAAIGGAITGVAGFGVAGAGIAGAILGDPEKFKQEWSVAAGTVKQEFLDATEVFTEPTLAAIRGIGPLIESWNLDETFADAARYVGPLVDGIEGLATGIVRGVSALVKQGEPAVKELSAGLVELGDAAGDAFEAIADGSEGGAAALRDTVTVVAGTIRLFGELTGAAEKAYGFIQDHPVEAAIGTGGISLGITLLDQFRDDTEQIKVNFDEIGDKGSAAFYGLDQQARDALSTVERLNDAFNETRDRILGLSNATIAVEQDLDDLAEGFKKGAGALDVTTQKGRDNLELINQTIDDLLRQRDAAIEAGGGTQEAYDKANAAFNTQLASLERLLVKLGLSAAAAKKLMDSYYNKEVTVTVKVRQVGNVSVEGVISSGDQRRNTGSAYAEGGTVTGTGPMLVGEEGPEIVWGSMGQFVSTAQQTQRLISQMSRSGGTGGGGGAMAVTVNFAGNTDQAFASSFQNLVRTGQIQILASAA